VRPAVTLAMQRVVQISAQLHFSERFSRELCASGQPAVAAEDSLRAVLVPALPRPIVQAALKQRGLPSDPLLNPMRRFAE
jgi:hypothetical protein